MLEQIHAQVIALFWNVWNCVLEKLLTAKSIFLSLILGEHFTLISAGLAIWALKSEY